MKWLVVLALLVFPIHSYAGECDYLVALRMDKSLTKKQKNTVERAARSWHKASNKRICFYIIEADVSKIEDYSRDDMTTIYSGNHPWHIVQANNHGCIYQLDKCLGITTPSKTRKHVHDIFLIKKKDFYQLVKHELGHVLGLQHSKNPKDLMYEDVRSYIKKLSKNDIRILKCLLDTKQLKNWSHTCK
jgi:hypothetical protein